ncbi:DMT family transporter [Pyruvatibacter sp.]|uniref:DMT family transporter n=1 Tax=Pyruvatibacter sp. TaxID=1981328 RepID=UPI0032EF4E7F
MTVQQQKARASAYWFALAPNVRGALWLLLSATLFTVMAVLAKTLGGRLDSFQVAFFRLLFGLVVIMPFLIRGGAAMFKTHYPVLQLVRGVVGSSAMLCGFYALIHLPLADALAYNFTKALFVVPLAYFILSEPAGPRRIGAVLVGFLGVLVMLRPTVEIDPAALVALGGALLVAMATILVKIVAKDAPVTLMFYTGVVGTCVAAIPAWLVWQQPTWNELGLLMLMGAAGAGAHNCFIRGYREGEATAIVPFDYSRLVFAGIAGFVIFGDVPDWLTIAGAVIIVATTLYIARREAIEAKALRGAGKGP